MNYHKIGLLLLLLLAGFMPHNAFAGTLQNVTVSPDNAIAGENSAYYFAFTTSETGNGTNVGIPADGKIKITVPAGFSISQVLFAASQNSNMNGGLTILSKSGQTIIIQRDNTGGAVGANIRILFGVAMIGNSASVQSATVSVVTSLANDTVIDSGTSVAFNIVAGEVDHFEVASIGQQTAGENFSITITARDAQDNRVTSFTGTANIMDLSGALSQTSTGNFVNGEWTGQTSITKAMNNNQLTIASIGVSGESNAFDIVANDLDHFEIEAISSPKTAGTAFNISIVARDVYDNQVTDFTDRARLTDDTGTLDPVRTSYFTNGAWSGSVTITKSENDVSISAEYSSAEGHSNSFNVNPAALNRFLVSSISTQAAGEIFSMSVTALDEFGNTVTSFNNTVSISDLTGTISPSVSGNFSSGNWTGIVKITQMRDADVIKVSAAGGIEGSSNSFNVTSNSIDHFVIDNISSPQVAGTVFNVRITAKDVEDNTVTDFSGTANLTDLTGSISPTVTQNFSNGVWNGNVTITESEGTNRITVTGSGKSGVTNSFQVDAAEVDHFTFETINSPQTAGTNFSITIYAEDVYNNRVTDFTSSATLSDKTGTLYPGGTGAFSSGVWTGNVNITKSEKDVQISVSHSGRTGKSNPFNVNPNELDHFRIGTVSTQAAGEPFSISVTALDVHNNIVTDFSSTVDLSDLTSSLKPTQSDNFRQGQWTGSVTVLQARTNNTISVKRTGGSETGISNAFNVISSSIDHFDISTIASPKTAGIGFSVTITAKDAADNTVTDFSGTANLRDLTGSLEPLTTDNFTNGVWTGTITITQSNASNSITVTSSGKAGNSNNFVVQPAALDHFTFLNISSPQVAAAGFSITIRAEDVYGNKVTSFTSKVTLSDATTTISPSQSGNFSAGEWTGNVTITKTQVDGYIQASGSGKTGESNKFNVRSGALTKFVLNTIETQVAGQPFAITVTAKDNNENTVGDFDGSATISDLTGSISPKSTGSFSSGVWSGNVTVIQTRSDNVISVRRNDGSETGESNAFDVVSNAVDHFVISNISSPQTAGSSFQITITAKDAQDNTVTSFNSNAAIGDVTGMISPKTTGTFSNGVRVESITITKSGADNQITVTAGGKAGTSNKFVVNPAGLDHFTFAEISSPQTAASAFSITITARDVYENLVTDFATKVNLTDNTNTISPAQSGDFSSGQWTGNVTLGTPQNDVRITASYSGKTGKSNVFNVNAGSLTQFGIETLSTQFAGEAFAVTITALDANNNQVTGFNGTVNISDRTGTITPKASGSFSNGKWVGTVTITQAYENNTITVQRTGGTEQGTSNSFHVIASSVDHYVISNIASPQTAGKAFKIKITAKDKDENTVTSYTGQLKLSDLTGTVLPKMTGSFVAGVWEDTIRIEKIRTANIVTVTNGTRAGNSNSFDVVPASLHHFKISEIPSPQTAGAPFTITISAVDPYENVVTSFTNKALLTSPGSVMTPTSTGNFSSGVWQGEITIQNQHQDVFIYTSYNSITGQSNSFNVEPAGVHHLILREQPGGYGNEIGDIILTLKDKLRVYAAGYDAFGNYVEDVSVNWSVDGTLEQPLPSVGTYTVLDPTVPGSEGHIIGSAAGINSATTGLITVGAISYIKIRTESGGNGVELGDITISADDSISLYAAGYDTDSNYLGEVSVYWQSTGHLEPVISDTSTSLVFSPTRAPRTGKFRVQHSTATGDVTGTISVIPGPPEGRIVLTAANPTLPADGVSTTLITSAPIYDSDGNLVATNQMFTVRTTRGEIIAPPDVSTAYPDWQVTPNELGIIEFEIKASTAGGTAFVTVNSTQQGSASGETVINMSSLNVLSVVTEHSTVSQGQSNIPVSVVVENIGSQGVSEINAGLHFTGPAPNFADRSTDYPFVTRTDQITQIPGGSRQTLNFSVYVGTTALNDSITIDAWVSGLVGESVVSDSSAEQTDKWRVQKPAAFQISKIEAFADTVSQGLDNVAVSMTVKNIGEANGLIELAQLKFWSIDENRDLPSDYQVFHSISNPEVIHGQDQEILNFTLNVGTTATLGEVRLDGLINGMDENTLSVIQDSDADTLDTWTVVSASVVGITSFNPSQASVSKNQTKPWFVTMKIKNNAATTVALDSANIKFLIGGNDITDEYVIYPPTYFMHSGTTRLAGGEEDSLRYVVAQTGSTLGVVTIDASVHLTDMQTSKSLTRSQKTGVKVTNPGLMKIQSVILSQSQVTLNQTVPWYVKTVVSNEGGSDIEINPSTDSTFVRIAPESGFKVAQPVGFQKSGNWILTGGSVDTLIFTVTQSGNMVGMFNTSVQIRGIELNTNQSVLASSTENIKITVENPATIRIFSVVSQAPNVGKVNVGQLFKIQVNIQNPVTESSDLKEVTVQLTSNGTSIETLSKTVDWVQSGSNATSVFFDVPAAGTATDAELFTAKILSAKSVNTGLLVTPGAALDSTESIQIQYPAELLVSEVIAPSSVRANQRNFWPIKVVVKNNGGAAIQFVKPTSQDVEIKINGEKQKDYILEPPVKLEKSGGLVLNGGVTDTLIYSVTTTGEISGTAQIVAEITAQDQNTKQELIETGETLISILTSARIVIRETTLSDCYVSSISGLGKANFGQTFHITTVVRNVGREAIENIVVKLNSNGNSTIARNELKIGSLPAEYGSIASVTFEVQADQVKRTEQFSASIVSAMVQGTSTEATIEASTDSVALVQIEKQAELLPRIINKEDSLLTKGQEVKLSIMVDNQGDAEVDDSGKITISAPGQYRLISSDGDTTSLSSTTSFVPDDSVFWRLQTPNFESGPDTIIVSISQLPTDLNSDEKAYAITRHDTLVIKTLPTNLLISSFEVSDPIGAMDDTLSTNQNFTIKATINFSRNLQDVTAQIIEPQNADYRINDEFTHLKNLKKSGDFYWEFRAPAYPDTGMKMFRLEVSAIENGVEINPSPDTLYVTTVPAAKINLDIFVSDPPGTEDNRSFAVNQQFEIKAIVGNEASAADVCEQGKLKIDFGSTGMTTVDSLVKTFTVGEEVTWQVKAPAESKTVDKIIATMVKRPLDENTYNPAGLSDYGADSDTLKVTTKEIGRVQNKISKITPPGAADSVLSSGQTFEVHVELSEVESVKDLYCQLSWPEDRNFSCEDNEYRKPVDLEKGETSVVFNVIAPEDTVREAILWVRCDGKDENNEEQKVFSEWDSVTVSVVRKAHLNFSAKIVEPEAACDQRVSPGSQFVVRFFCDNVGMADYHHNELEVQIVLPNSYTLVEGETERQHCPGDYVDWTVQAPDRYQNIAGLINFIIPTVPLDENTGDKVAELTMPDVIQVRTLQKSLRISQLTDVTPKSVVRGETQVPMLGFIFENYEDGDASSDILLRKLKVNFKDKDGRKLTNPASAISKITVASANNYEKVYGELSGAGITNTNPLELNFTNVATINYLNPDSLVVLVDVSKNSQIPTFKVTVDSLSWFDFVIDGTNDIRPNLEDASGNTLRTIEFASDFSVIFEADLEKSFCNYPNPFGKMGLGTETTTFVYYLDEQTNISLKIFTLIGQLVWHRDYLESDPQGDKGMHDKNNLVPIIWDGTNDYGHRVLNGVYLAVLTTGNGKTVTTKVAFIK